MQLKNYQEDLVLHVIQIALEDRPEIRADEAFVHDVASYTLNRIPPRYIQSERGFTRLAVAHLCDSDSPNGELAGMIEMLLLVNRAIDIVRSRRENAVSEVPGDGDGIPAAQARASAAELGFWHNFPYLLGRVVDEKTGEPVYGVTVTAFIDGEKSIPAEPGWQNPYRTLQATRGYFSFLPRAVRSGEEKKQFSLSISFEHPRYKPAVLEKTIRTRGEFEVRTTIGSEDILNLAVTRLAAVS